MTEIKAVVFDLDGTIYLGNNVIDGAVQVIEKLHELGIKTFYLTNNSSKTRAQIYTKLKKMGVPCDINDIYTSAYVAARYIKKLNLDKLYVFGTNDLKKEISDHGTNICEDENLSENLIIGFDMDCTFEKIAKALRAALHANIILTCNKEKRYPGQDGKIMPGCGAMTAAIEWCSDKKINYIIGKPETTALEILCDENKLKNNEIVVVGDTFESDIAMANKFNSASILIGHNEKKDILQIDAIADFFSAFNLLSTKNNMN